MTTSKDLITSTQSQIEILRNKLLTTQMSEQQESLIRQSLQEKEQELKELKEQQAQSRLSRLLNEEQI